MEDYDEHIIEKRQDGNLLKETYLLNGKYHRLNKPAYIEYYQHNQIYQEFYYLNGKNHRTNGPAIVKYKEDGKIIVEVYYLLHKYITKKHFYTPGFVDLFILNNN